MVAATSTSSACAAGICSVVAGSVVTCSAVVCSVAACSVTGLVVGPSRRVLAAPSGPCSFFSSGLAAAEVLLLWQPMADGDGEKLKWWNKDIKVLACCGLSQ